MTAVVPVLTRICVSTLSVTIPGVPETRIVLEGWLFSTFSFMMTVSSAVICGVTTSLSDAGTYWTSISVAVVVTTGICTPCSMVAGWLFCVAIFVQDRIR